MGDRFHWKHLLALVTGLVNQELLLHNEYLAAENRILKARLPSRFRLSDPERSTLGEIASDSDASIEGSGMRCQPGQRKIAVRPCGRRPVRALQKPSINMPVKTGPCFVGVFHTLNQRRARSYH